MAENEKSFNNVAAFEKLFKKNYEWLCSYVVKLGADKYLAEEIVQEVFIKLWESRESIEIKISFRSYILKCCHYRYLEHLRFHKRENNFLEFLRLKELYRLNEDEHMRNRDRKELVKNAIELLPPKCKEAFILSRYNKLKYREIAEEMGISIKTVETHISKALTLLCQNIPASLPLCTTFIFFF